MIISIVNLKGGVAKTTTSIYFAQAAIKEGCKTSIILDADPQASAYLWYKEVRKSAGFLVAMTPSPLMLKDYVNHATRDELIIIDTPPTDSPIGIIAAAIEVADFILIPTKAGALEPKQVIETINLCGDKPKGLLITDAKLGTNCLKETKEGWKISGYPLLGVITNRTFIATDASTGKINEYAVAQHQPILSEILKQERVTIS
jgi:chromosome partitioning protein